MTPHLCPRPCGYYDQDGVVCNEEPHNCPVYRKAPRPQEAAEK